MFQERQRSHEHLALGHRALLLPWDGQGQEATPNKDTVHACEFRDLKLSLWLGARRTPDTLAPEEDKNLGSRQLLLSLRLGTKGQ